VESAGGRLTGVRLADGTRVALDALVVAPKVVATRIAADPRSGAAGVPGIYLAGNVTDPMAQVISSAAAGLMAGAALNLDLIAEDTATRLSERVDFSPRD
jgi:thioredoxin reductase